jgi:hypothetical protein
MKFEEGYNEFKSYILELKKGEVILFAIEITKD